MEQCEEDDFKNKFDETWIRIKCRDTIVSWYKMLEMFENKMS